MWGKCVASTGILARATLPWLPPRDAGSYAVDAACFCTVESCVHISRLAVVSALTVSLAALPHNASPPPLLLLYKLLEA